MNILEEIAGKTRERIGQEKGKVSVAELKERIRDREQNPAILPTPSFYQALKKEGMSYICEVKKASPSKGLIAPDFPYVEITKEYEAAGASAISCLTEPFYFQGSDRYLEEITAAVNIPVLRKDFTVDEYMIYQAKAFGASAVFVEIGKTLGVDLGITTLLGFFVLASLLVNEIRSICVNLVEMGVDVPKILIKGLEVADKAINKDGEDIDEGE